MSHQVSEKRLAEFVATNLSKSFVYDSVVDDVESSCDGYWVYLKRGYHDGSNNCHTIHEYTLADIKREVKGIVVVDYDEDWD